MPNSSEHLQTTLRRAYRRLEQSLAGLPAGEANGGRQPGWRRYRFGVGLDGSIAGIVHHLAAWKEAAAEGLESGCFPPAEEAIPDGISWEVLLERLSAAHQRLTRLAAEMTAEQLDETVEWEGQRMTRLSLLTHMVEHDHYHTGQINLLRQQLGHTLE